MTTDKNTADLTAIKAALDDLEGELWQAWRNAAYAQVRHDKANAAMGPGHNSEEAHAEWNTACSLLSKTREEVLELSKLQNSFFDVLSMFPMEGEEDYL